ncbi:MAG: lysophospholipid acyltransferase family protein [Marivibrio sp.]|uniref:lysophospholipid acyltransferase family protein n=1 Tax=Marivibrio sp. TaxID=2039719 RepID=UPI0032EEC17B
MRAVTYLSPDKFGPPGGDPLAELDARLADRVTYSAPDDPIGKRTLIKGVELLTGQPKLQRLYDEYRRRRPTDDDFWRSAVEYLRLEVRFDRRALAAVPKTGPLILIANHPFGVLDGIAAGHILSGVRRDFKLIAHAALGRAQVFRPYLIPIAFEGDSAALRSNVHSKRIARAHLRDGGSLVIFPAGRVSTAKKMFGTAVDDPWKLFPATLIQTSGAPVLPVHFEGQNGRLFHFVSKFSGTLREALILREVVRRIGGSIAAQIGAPMPPEDLARFDDRQALLDHVRARVYDLAPR